MDTPDLSIQALRKAYESGALTPEKVIADIYARIESQPLNPVWITLVPRIDALAKATALGAQKDLPLFGVPFAVKDNIDVAGLPTTAGCPSFAHVAERSAFVVTKLQEAGAILIGKTNLDQFATGLVGSRSPYGACASVFDSNYISGGSSSGSAVSVASGLVTFSLGTDTAGSGRVPAAFNNIVGLKPSRGLLSASGVVPACRSLDCVSIFALSCSDASAVMRVAEGFDANDVFSRARTHPGRPSAPIARLGVPRLEQREFFGNNDYQSLYAETIVELRTAGYQIVDIDLDPFREAAQLLYAGPYVAERFAAVGEFVKAHTDSVDPTVGPIITDAEKWTAAEAFAAQYKLNELRLKTAHVWDTIDALLLPTAPTTYTLNEVKSEPVKLNSNLGYYTNFVNLLDLSAVAVPAGFTNAGLPFGVTAIAPAFSEEALLAFGHAVQVLRAPIPGHHLTTIAESAPELPASKGWISVGVIGAHLSGQPLNNQLLERGARLLQTTRTATAYQLFALNTKPLKPGLVRVPGFNGGGVEIEVWTMHESQFGSFVAAIPPPLSIGSCELENGEIVKGFLCEPYATSGMPDITHLGGWRNYLNTLK